MPRVTVAPHTPALAADFNAVADQSLMTFPTAAARTAAIPTPTEGMHTYRTDANALEYWNGTAWVTRAPVVPASDVLVGTKSADSPWMQAGTVVPTASGSGAVTVPFVQPFTIYLSSVVAVIADSSGQTGAPESLYLIKANHTLSAFGGVVSKIGGGPFVGLVRLNYIAIGY